MAKQAIPNSTRINVILPNQTLKIAKFLAARRGTTYSELIRQAMAEYLRDELLKEKQASAKINELGLEVASDDDNGSIAKQATG
jgi:hypothetical protein